MNLSVNSNLTSQINNLCLRLTLKDQQNTIFPSNRDLLTNTKIFSLCLKEIVDPKLDFNLIIRRHLPYWQAKNRILIFYHQFLTGKIPIKPIAKLIKISKMNNKSWINQTTGEEIFSFRVQEVLMKNLSKIIRREIQDLAFCRCLRK